MTSASTSWGRTRVQAVPWFTGVTKNALNTEIWFPRLGGGQTPLGESSFTNMRSYLWVSGMSKRLPGLVIEVESLPEFLAKSDEDILQHVRSVRLHRAYAVQRAQLAKCDGVQFSPTKDSCVFAAKGRALLHVRFAQLKA